MQDTCEGRVNWVNCHHLPCPSSAPPNTRVQAAGQEGWGEQEGGAHLSCSADFAAPASWSPLASSFDFFFVSEIISAAAQGKAQS